MTTLPLFEILQLLPLDVIKSVFLLLVVFSVLRAFGGVMDVWRPIGDDFKDRDDVNFLDVDTTEYVYETYQVRQRRLRKYCEYCGNRIAFPTCKTCGGQSSKYEYRLVDRQRRVPKSEVS